MHMVLSNVLIIRYCNLLCTVDGDMLLYKNEKSLVLKVSMKMTNVSKNMYKDTL